MCSLVQNCLRMEKVIFKTLLVVYFSSVCVLTTERGTLCTTPYGEVATCIPILSCPGLVTRMLLVLQKNEDTTDYLRSYQCGFDSQALVCCRFEDYPTGFFDAFTKSPSQEYTGSTSKPCDHEVELFPELALVDLTTLPEDMQNCGKVTSHSSEDQINSTKFPWTVALEYTRRGEKTSELKCSGSLVSSQFVLTAAHCVSTIKYKLTNVWLGNWEQHNDTTCRNSRRSRECSNSFEIIKIHSVVPYPFYSEKTGNNDIALLKLERPVKFNDYIQPICLPTIQVPALEIGSNLTSVGWRNANYGATSVRVTVTTYCKAVEPLRYININQICLIGSRDKESYESGGVLMRLLTDKTTKSQKWFQEGIGSRRSFSTDTLVYTRIARYIRWIINIIKTFNQQKTYGYVLDD